MDAEERACVCVRCESLSLLIHMYARFIEKKKKKIFSYGQQQELSERDEEDEGHVRCGRVHTELSTTQSKIQVPEFRTHC